MASILDYSGDPKKKYGAVAKKDTIFISDPQEYKLRKQAFADSSYAFNNLSTTLSPQKQYQDIKNSQVEGAEVPYSKPKDLTDSDKKKLLKSGVGYKGIAPVKVMRYDEKAEERNVLKGLDTSVYTTSDNMVAENPWYKDPTQVPIFQEKPNYVDPFTIAAKKIEAIPLSSTSRVLELPDINYINQQEIAMNQPPKPVYNPQMSKHPGAAIQGQRRPDYGRQIRNAQGEKSTRAKLIDLIYDEQGNVRDKKMYAKYKNEIAKMNADENYLMNLSPLPDGNLTDADWNKNEAPMTATQEVSVEKQPEQIVPEKSVPESIEKKQAPEVKTPVSPKFTIPPITELDLLLEVSKPEPTVEEMDADETFKNDSEKREYAKRLEKYKDEEGKRVIKLKKYLDEAKAKNDITTIEKVSEALNTIKKFNDDAEAKKPFWVDLKKKNKAAFEAAKGEKESEAELEVPVKAPPREEIPPQEVPKQTVPVRTGKGSAAEKEKEKMTRQERRLANLEEDPFDSIFGGPMKPPIIDTPIKVEKKVPTPTKSFEEREKEAMLKRAFEAVEQSRVEAMKPIDYDKALAGYKPTWFQNNTVEDTFGKRSKTDTEETKEARGAALRILKAADISADKLKDWFSRGKGYDMLRNSVAEDLAWEKGIDVKDVPQQEIYDATFQLIANRTSQFQNAKLGFEERDRSGGVLEGHDPSDTAGFVTSEGSPPWTGPMTPKIREFMQDELYRRPSVFQRQNAKGEMVQRIPKIDFPESFLRRHFAGFPSKFNKELDKEYESGKISKDEYQERFIRDGMHTPVEKVVSHEVSHLADILMPRADLKFIQDIVDKRNAGKERDEYLSDPREIMARIRNMRDWWASQKQDSGDKSDFTREQLSDTGLDIEIEELTEGAGLTWEDIVKIANKVSANQPKKKKTLMDVASA